MSWLPIDTAPQDSRVMFVVRAYNAEIGRGHLYTSDPWCVWSDDFGRFMRWPHPFPPTHWMPLPEPPK